MRRVRVFTFNTLLAELDTLAVIELLVAVVVTLPLLGYRVEVLKFPLL